MPDANTHGLADTSWSTVLPSGFKRKMVSCGWLILLISLAILLSQAGERACLDRRWRNSGAMFLHSDGSGTDGVRT